MLNELKFALRKLRRAPGFTTVAILTIAIAVGANTAILSIADAVLFKPLPYRDPDRVFLLQMRNPADGRMFTNVSLDYVKRLDEHHQGLSAAGTFEGLGRSLETMTPAGVEFVPMVVTSASYFDVLGIRPQLGRLFTAADYADRERPLVLSDASWRSRFAADRGIVGRRVSFGSRSFDVIGVLPRDFVMPSTFGGKPEVFLLQEPPTKPGGGTFHPIFRLEPGVSREQAQTEINALIGPLLNLGGDARQAMPWLLEIGATIYPTGRAIMGFLLAAALMVLLLAAANLGNLMLTRGRQAERQTAVQMALGASRIDVVRPIVIEALIIGLAGSALAIAINAAMFDSLASMVPSVAYGNAHIGVSTRVGALALALGLAASVLFALVPAWRASRLDVQALVQQRSAGGSPRARLGRPMIALQVAVAVILLFGAIVASRAFVAILRTPLGFTPDRVVTVGVSLPRDRADVRAFYTAVRDAVASVAGVQYAGASGSLPLSSSAAPWTTATRPGGTDGVGVIHVLPGYFEAAGLIVQRGRTLTDTSTPAEIVLSASAARSLFGTADPLGQTVTDGRTDTWQIVGVVNDVRNSIDRNTPAVGYAVPGGRTTTLAVVARTVARTGTLDQDIAAAVRAIAPRSRVTVRWWEDVIADTTAYKNPRFQTSVLSSFAAIALALTVLGLFGLVSYVVAARTREFGIRLAIGASPRSLVALTMRQMLVPVSVGILGGLIATRWLAQLAEAQLFKVETRDPGTLAIAVIVVVIAAMIAAYLPARRAERVDPLIALRTE